MESLGPPPAKPPKPPVVSLLPFQRQAAALSKIPAEGKGNASLNVPASPRSLAFCLDSQVSLLEHSVSITACLTQRPWQLAHEMTNLRGRAPYHSWASQLPPGMLRLITGNLSKRKKRSNHWAGRPWAFMFPVKPVHLTRSRQEKEGQAEKGKGQYELDLRFFQGWPHASPVCLQ